MLSIFYILILTSINIDIDDMDIFITTINILPSSPIYLMPQLVR